MAPEEQNPEAGVETNRFAPAGKGRSRNSRRLDPAPDKGVEEHALFEAFRGGDHRAFDRIFRLHSKRVYQVAYRILGDRDETEEIVQEVFWTIYRKAKTFRGSSRLFTWVYRLTVNAALGKLRKKRRSKDVSYEEFLPKFQEDGHHLVRPVVDWSNEIEEHRFQSELRQLLQKALEQLRPHDKAVVVLSDVEGFSDKEVADTLGLSVSAVKTRLHRARLFLRGKLAVYLGHSAA